MNGWAKTWLFWSSFTCVQFAMDPSPFWLLAGTVAVAIFTKESRKA